MNEAEQLYAQYEDAFFALVMHRIAEAEGERLLEINRQLQADPDAAVPEELTKRCLRLIRRHSGKVRRKKTIRQTARVLNRVAVAVLISILLFASVCAVYEPLRVKTLNFFVEKLDVGTAFLFPSKDAQTHVNTSADILSSVMDDIPEGFSLETSDEDSISYTYIFRSTDGKVIDVTGYWVSNISGRVVVDTENAEVWYETVQGQQVMLVQKEHPEDITYQIVWVCDANRSMTIVRGVDVCFDTLRPIAERIIRMQG